MTDELLEALKTELRLTDAILADRDATIALIPECPIHGPACQSHARDWIRNAIAGR